MIIGILKELIGWYRRKKRRAKQDSAEVQDGELKDTHNNTEEEGEGAKELKTAEQVDAINRQSGDTNGGQRNSEVNTNLEVLEGRTLRSRKGRTVT